MVDFLEKLAPLAESALRKIEIEGEKVKIDDEECKLQYDIEKTSKH